MVINKLGSLFSFFLNDSKIKIFKKSGNEELDLSLYPTIEETIKTIFPRAENADIKKYVKQISKADELDPVLVITPNQTWVTNYGWIAFNNAMDHFATYNLNNQRRDELSRCIFHFKEIQELYTVRDGIRSGNLIPNGFHIPRSLQGSIVPGTNNPVPIGQAYLVTKLGVKKSEFAEDTNFFHIA
ncbi:hypothetical protein C1645_734276 [Glomus cerebriforme]|uniref:Uncharacterized protein n=1 Tax=Glomus cerebriforme TaxID=658196 RepID=A0A397TDS8_9GLOM|nr:hypothetical protein C1645_734276 [Glomus cerebriforme]